ncbi:MAG: hypothetical protein AB1457_16285 [Chloroflexota bacterium]
MAKGKALRQAIIEAAIVELGRIRAPEFRTNIGQRVFYGRAKVDPNTEIPCIVVAPAVETAQKEAYRLISREMELRIDAVAAATVDVEAMIADIFEAMMGGEATIKQAGGLGLRYSGCEITDYPDVGDRIIGVSLRFSVIYRTQVTRADI